ncbi:MAG: M48 family metallopeptidase [Oligoflexia bacterium]|nr:M48 family metallopeptidase [Oligoflexia bacterium]
MKYPSAVPRSFPSLLLVLVLGFVAAPAATQGATLETLGERELDGLLPAFLIDSSGFILPKDFPLAAQGPDSPMRVAPLFPMFKSQWLSKKFVGVTVPAKYLGSSDEIRQASSQIRTIRLEDGKRLVPYFHKGTLYGIRDDIRVTNVRSTTVGISFTFGGGETLNLGEEFVIGSSIQLGGTTIHAGGERGLNLGNSVNQVFHGLDLAVTGDKAEELIAKTALFTPYIRQALAANAAESALASTGAPLTVYNQRFELAPDYRSPELRARIDRAHLSKELTGALRNLRENLPPEAKWRTDLAKEVGSATIVNDPDASALIQSACDYLAQVYELPADVWPKCRIAATWQPNAWAYPGGDIFITAGLLGILSDLDSVLLVLGHEIGHVAARHTTKRMPYVNALNYTANGIGIAVSTAAAVTSLGGGLGLLGDVTFLTWYPQAMASSLITSAAANAGMKVLFFAPLAALMAHSRGAEWQADRLGHETALAAGADQSQIHRGWGEFSSYVSRYFGVTDSAVARLMADHPDGQDRHEAIEERFSDGRYDALRPYQAANRLAPDFYAAYQRLHAEFTPGATQFGEQILRKRGEGNPLPQEYAAASLLAPAGRCIHYALGGAH